MAEKKSREKIGPRFRWQLRNRMARKGWGPSQLAEKARVSKSTISRILSETTTEIFQETRQKLERALGCQENELHGKSTAAFDALIRSMSQRFHEGSGRHRVVFVAGSVIGNSAGVRAWDELAGDLLEESRDYFKGETFLDFAWRRLAPRFGELADEPKVKKIKRLREAKTDEIGRVVSEIPPLFDHVRDWLRGKYSFDQNGGPPPTIASELLCHLVRQSFADHIITGDVHSLLERAMSNELGDEGYFHITSDSECASADPDEKPCLIQMNGSIQRSNTLRFAIDEQRLTKPLEDLLDRIIHAQDGDIRTTIVSVGYAWNDKGLLDWLYGRKHVVDRLVILKSTSDIPASFDRYERELSSELELYVLPAEELCERSPMNVDEFVWAVCQHLYESTDGSEQISPLSRHLILGALFGARSGRPMVRHSATTRLACEIALLSAKTRGLINLADMARISRVNRYYRAAHDESKSGAGIKHPKDTLLGLLEPVERSLGSDFESSGNELYLSKHQGPEALAESLLDLVPDSERRKRVLCPVYEDEEISLTGVGLQAFLRDEISKIWDAPSESIIARVDDAPLWRFRAPEAIQSSIELRRRTEQLLDSEWSHLFVISEEAEWLRTEWARPLVTSANRRVLLLKASLPPALDRVVVQEHESFIVGELPMIEHDRHLTLTYDERTTRFGGAIYFRRPAGASAISPLFLRSWDDCIEVLSVFSSYVERAARLGDSGAAEISKAVRSILQSLPRSDPRS